MATWTTPKTDWVKTDYVTYADYNRIKNNLTYLNDLFNTIMPDKAIEIDLGDDYTYEDSYTTSSFDALEEVLESFKRIGQDWSVGQRPSLKDNGAFVDYSELIRLEKSCLRYYEHSSEMGSAGLYDIETDALIYSWQQLLDLGYFEEADGVLSFGSNIEGLRSAEGKLVVSDTITKVNHNTFSYLEGISIVELQEGVTDISYAFYYATGVEKVILPESLQTVSAYSFYHCENLREVVLSPHTVSIESGAFYYCENLTSITFPSTLLTIKASAFYHTGLQSVVFKEGLQEIGTSAFGYTPISSVTLPESLITCNNAFPYTAITAIHIPKNVTTFSINRSEDNIQQYTVANENQSYSASDGVLFNKDKTKLLKFPCARQGSYSVPNTVTEISNDAFCYTNITSITLPSSVKTLGEYCFYYSKITGINISNVTTLNRFCFGFSNITSLTVPSTITTIPSYACRNCTLLQSVTLNEGLTDIQDSAFAGCTSLTSLHFPASLSYNRIRRTSYMESGITSFSVASGADCYAIDGVIFTNGINQLWLYPPARTGSYVVPSNVWTIYGQAFEGTKISAISGGHPENYIEIQMELFQNCKELVSVSFPQVTKINNYVFSNCENLTSVTFSPNLYYIGEYAFRGTKLQSFTIGDGVEEIGNLAFFEMQNLPSFTVSASNSHFSAQNGVLYDKNKTELICYPAGKSGASFTIPSSVTKIRDCAFAQCKLTSLTIPSTVTSLGGAVIRESQNLTSLNIQATGSVVSPCIKCSNITTLTLGNGITVADLDCNGCDNLATINLSQSITNIFITHAEKVEHLTLPNGVTIIRTLTNMPKLKTVNIPAGVISLATLTNCDSLESVTFNSPSSWSAWRSAIKVKDVDLSNPSQNALLLRYNLRGLTLKKQ